MVDINWLTSDGKELRSACGKITVRMALKYDKPSERAHSICPLGKPKIPARTISAK